MQWKKINDLKESLDGYGQSTENINQMTQRYMQNSKLNTAQFIDHLSASYLLKTSKLNETSCYKSHFDLMRIGRSFQSEIIRSQVPMENLLTELRGKLDGINNTINMYQDLANSKYSVCKVSNKNSNCEEETDLWLERIISTVRCQFSPNCLSHMVSKRSASDFCSFEKFACDSTKCLSPTSVCDGRRDCNDGTDESACCRNPFGHTIYNKFSCGDNCLDNSKVCDGKDDCNDGSDEFHCGKMTSDCNIEIGKYKCDSRKCIGLDQVCDGRRDCNDGSDEGYHCGKGLCPEECTKEGGVCFHGPTGPLCFAQCPLGTFESPEGCTALPQPSNRTVVELLEEIPKLTDRLNAKLTHIKIKAVVTLSRMMTDVFKCLDPNYPALAKVRSFPLNNKTEDDSHSTKSYPIKQEVTTEIDYLMDD